MLWCEPPLVNEGCRCVTPEGVVEEPKIEYLPAVEVEKETQASTDETSFVDATQVIETVAIDIDEEATAIVEENDGEDEE